MIHPSMTTTTNPIATAGDVHPSTPTNYHKHFFNSPKSVLFNSRHPSPAPRDDIIEGMSLSTSSIFERDVEHFEAALTAQDAIQLAVPPVLDEAIEVLATVPPEQIMVDQIPLQVHLFNQTPSPVGIDSTPSSPTHQSTPPVQLPITANSNRFGLYQPSPIPSSSSALHPRARSISSYPFPTGSDSDQPISMNPSACPSRDNGAPSSPPITRFHHQPMSCTSDTASISDPSSPRSLSPTPSFMVGRSMFTQLADHDANATPMCTHTVLPLTELSSNPPSKAPGFTSSTIGNQPHLRERKTCISFMSYVDILNSERADLNDSPAPLTSAMNALRMARKSTSSLVKKASSIFSHPPRRRGTSTNTRNNVHESIEKERTSRSRCTSTYSNYHSCPTHQPTIGESGQIFPISSSHSDNNAEVLSASHWS